MELQESPKSASEQTRRAPAPTSDQGPTPPAPLAQRKPTHPLSKWWHSWISRTILHGPGIQDGDPRDYLALERTFLGWIRTSLALISLGVIVTQLFILQDLDRTKGIVLGSILTGGGMAIVVGAAVRYFRAQDLLIRGKALTGGWEAVGIWVVLVGVVGALFIVVVVEV